MGRRRTIDDERILAAARDVFRAHGAAASTRAVARAAGISEAVLYQRYGSKAALFLAAVTPDDLTADDLLGPGAELDWQHSPVEARRYLVVMLERLIDRCGDLAPMLWQALAHRWPDDQGPLYRWRRASPVTLVVDELSERLRVLANRGILGVEDPVRAAELLAACAFAMHAFRGARPPATAVFEPGPGPSPAEAIVDDLWMGFAPRRASAARAVTEQPAHHRANVVLTAEEVEARTTHAVRTAADVARGLGLDVREPRVLHAGFDVIVHVAPAPVVVRVPVVMPPTMRGNALRARQQRALDISDWLARRGCPVIPPSALVPVTPVTCDDFVMTCWEMAQRDADGATDSARGDDVGAAMLVELHTTMRRYPRPDRLPFVAAINFTVPPLLDRLDGVPGLVSDADRRQLARQRHVLGRLVDTPDDFARRFPDAVIQPVHGDDPLRHLVHTSAGRRFAGFEEVTLAPIEWDLALCTHAEIVQYNFEAARRGLPLANPEVLELMQGARMLQLVSHLALVPELPSLAERLAPVLEEWRARPMAREVVSNRWVISLR